MYIYTNIYICMYIHIYMYTYIKTSGSESPVQEEVACVYAFSDLRDHYSELFTRMAALKL